MTDQPHTVGYASASGAFPASATATVSDRGLNAARGMRPWLILFAVLLFIGVGLAALGLLGMLAVGIIGLVSGTGDGLAGGALVLAMAVVYGLILCVLLFPGIHLVRCAGAIKRLNHTRDGGDLDDALAHMRAYWKLLGILLLTLIGLYVLFFGIVLVLGLGFAAFAPAPAAPPNTVQVTPF